MRFLIKTSGKGMLPAGRTVGHIEAETAQKADDNLIAKGGLPVKYRGFFEFVPVIQNEYLTDDP